MNESENMNPLVDSKTESSRRHWDLANKATIMVVSRAITILMQLITLMILARILSKDDFGLLTFVLLAYSTIVTISQIGLPESIFYFFERVPKAARKSLVLLTARSLLLIGIVSSLILVVLTFLAPRWGFQVDNLLLLLIWLAMLELPTIPMANILIAIDRAKQAAWFNIICSLTQFTALIIPAALGYPLQTIILCLLGYGAVRFLLSLFLFFKNFKEKGEGLPADMMRQQFRYSVPLGFAQILWSLNRQIDKYIVAAFLPVVIYSDYVIGAWEIPLLPAIAFSVASVMMPQFVSSYLKGDREELLSLWFKAIKKISTIVLPLTILFLLIAEEFISLAFSDKYMRAVLPFRIYTIILIQRVAAYSSMLKAVGATRAITYSAIYLIAINLILSLIFVQWWGIAGPPLATLLANFFTWGYALFKIRTALGVNLKQVFPFPFYLKTLLIAIISGIPVLLLERFLQNSHIIDLIWKVTLYCGVFILLATYFKIVGKQDWAYLLRWKNSGA